MDIAIGVSLFVSGEIPKSDIITYFCSGVLAPIIKMQLNANRTTTNIRNSISLSVTINASPFTIGFMATIMMLVINVLKMAILAILFCSFDKLFHSFIRNDLLYSINCVSLQCSPGHSSPRY